LVGVVPGVEGDGDEFRHVCLLQGFRFHVAALLPKRIAAAAVPSGFCLCWRTMRRAVRLCQIGALHMTYNFKGKTAVVTGASRGIGEAIARTLAEDCAKVALVARSGDKLKALAASLPNGAVAIEADMSSPNGWRAAAEGALKALGEIDILVNNAGVSA